MSEHRKLAEDCLRRSKGESGSVEAKQLEALWAIAHALLATEHTRQSDLPTREQLQAERDELKMKLDAPPPYLTAANPEPRRDTVVIDAGRGIIVREAGYGLATWYAVSEFKWLTWPEALERGPLRMVYTPPESQWLTWPEVPGTGTADAEI